MVGNSIPKTADSIESFVNLFSLVAPRTMWKCVTKGRTPNARFILRPEYGDPKPKVEFRHNAPPLNRLFVGPKCLFCLFNHFGEWMIQICNTMLVPILPKFVPHLGIYCISDTDL